MIVYNKLWEWNHICKNVKTRLKKAPALNSSPIFKSNQNPTLPWARQWLAECIFLASANSCRRLPPKPVHNHTILTLWTENAGAALPLSVHPQCNADRTELATYAFMAFLPNNRQSLFKHDCLHEVWFLKSCSSVKSLPVFIRVLQGAASQRELFPCQSLTFKHKLFCY